MLGAALTCLLLLAEPAAAPSRSIEEAIDVDPAGHGCLDAAHLAEQVAVWLGHDQLDERIRIVVRALPERRDRVHFQVWRGEELLVDRPFEPVPENCDRAHAALGLAIAIAIDSTILEPFGIEAPTSPEPAGVTSEAKDAGQPPEPASQEPEPEALEPTPAPTPPSRDEVSRRMAARIQGTVATGLHPTVGFGGRLRTELHLDRRFALRVGGSATRGLAASVGPGSATVTLVTGDVDACAGGVANSVRLHGCLGVAGGATIANGLDLASNARSVSEWLAAVAGLAVTYPDHSIVALGIDLELAVPILRPRLVVIDSITKDVGASRDFPVVGGLLSVGPVVQFP